MKWASCVHSHAMFSGRRLSMPALAGSRCTSWSWRSSRWRSENGLDSHQLGEMDSTSSRLDGRRRVPLARPRQGRVSVVRPRLLLTGALLSAALACHRSRPPGFDPDCGPVDVATGVRLDHLATHVDSQLLSKSRRILTEGITHCTAIRARDTGAIRESFPAGGSWSTPTSLSLDIGGGANQH
jgi:hypothetical protein